MQAFPAPITDHLLLAVGEAELKHHRRRSCLQKPGGIFLIDFLGVLGGLRPIIGFKMIKLNPIELRAGPGSVHDWHSCRLIN